MAASGGSVNKRKEAVLKDSRTGNEEEATPASEHGLPAGRDISTAEYCGKLQEWMWQYYCGHVSWQSWVTVTASSFPPCFHSPGAAGAAGAVYSLTQVTSATSARNGSQRGADGPAPHGTTPGQQQQNGNAPQAGQEYVIPSPLQRFFAEMVDVFILFAIKATIVLSIVHLSGMKDISKFALHFIVEEIEEDTSMEDLQKMMLVALVYRILVCFYEIVCIWGAGGATPGKFLLGLQVVTCDTSVLVQPNRVRVVPATDVSLSASTVRALNKNFSIAFFFPAFITLLFFQHNRTVYDIVAGTIVVKRNRPR